MRRAAGGIGKGVNTSPGQRYLNPDEQCPKGHNTDSSLLFSLSIPLFLVVRDGFLCPKTLLNHA